MIDSSGINTINNIFTEGQDPCALVKEDFPHGEIHVYMKGYIV